MTQIKNVNIVPDGSINRVHVSQGDIGRTLQFNLYDGALAYTPTTGSTVKIQGTKPSGFGFSEACTWSGNVVTVDTTDEMTDEYGYIDTELVITSSDESEVLGTANFILAVERNPHPDNITDGTQITAQSLQVQIDELAEIIESGDIDVDVEAQIAQYIDEHNIEGVTDEEVQAMVDSYLDESMGESVADYLDAHPELITNVQDGSITYAKLANDVKTVIESSGETMATTVPVGKLFNTGYAYSSWVHNNVKYDATNDVICVMVNNSDSHGSATYRDILLFKLNPRTLEVVDTIEVNKSATSGKQFEVYGFAILSNGTYMFLPCYDTAVSGQSSDKLMVWTSSDYGETWTETEATTTSLISQTSYQWFGLTALSSGMLVCTEYNSHSILHSSDSGSSWTAQRMSSNSTHEPTFIDCGNNKIICYCRKTMYGTSNGQWNGTKRIEPAVYHTSTDGGITWTYQGDSTSITEMTACNCACAVHNGYADMYVCSRYPHGDSVGVVYHYFAKLDNVFNDTWGTPKVVLYPSATSASNFSYMGVAVDSVGTQHAFYYDSTAENQAEIRYFMASRKGVPMPVNADLSNALKIPYSKEKVDALLQTLKSSLTAKINDLIIESGGTIPDEGDATYYITDGLFEAWDFTDESKYDATTFTQTGIKGVASLKRSGANWGQSTPSDTSFGAQQTIRNYWRNVSTNDFSSVTVSNGYSVDFVVKRTAIATVGTDTNATFDVNFQKRDNATSRYAYISSDDGSTKSVWTNLASGTYYALNDYAGQVTHHAYAIDSTELKYYQNGVLKQTVSVSDITDFSTWANTAFSYTGHLGNSANTFYPTKLRIYTKVLTQAEVKNNSDYEQAVG